MTEPKVTLYQCREEWVAARTIESAKAFLGKENRHNQEAVDEMREITNKEINTLLYYYDIEIDTEKSVTFKERLIEMISNKETFPSLFAIDINNL